MSSDPTSAFYGVRLGKEDGDDEYRWAMTRPDPPYLPPPARPAIEAAPAVEAETPVEDSVIHVVAPTVQAFAFVRLAGRTLIWTEVNAEVAASISLHPGVVNLTIEVDTDSKADLAFVMAVLADTLTEREGHHIIPLHVPGRAHE